MALAVSEASKVIPLLERLTGRRFSLCVKLYGDNAASVTVINRQAFFVKTWRTRAFALSASWLRDQVRLLNLTLTHHPGATLVACPRQSLPSYACWQVSGRHLTSLRLLILLNQLPLKE